MAMAFYRLLQYPDRVETYICPDDTGFNGFDQVWRPTSWLATATADQLATAGVAACTVTGDAWGDPSAFINTYAASGTDVVVTSVRRPDLPPVPDEVEMWAAKTVLASEGLRAIVEFAVSQADTETQLLWYTAKMVQRQHPKVIELWASVGGTPAKLDALFIAAKLIADGAA